MKKYIEYAKENKRFASAIITNAIALIASVWWLIDSNFKDGSSIEIEPIVTVLALTATLLGINYVNDKLTRPHLKVKLSMAIAAPPGEDVIHGIDATIENHSMIKAYIKNFKATLPKEKKVMQFLYDGFTKQPLQGITIEPGQSKSIHIVASDIANGPQDPEDYGDFIVTTDLGYKFIVPGEKFRDHLSKLLAK